MSTHDMIIDNAVGATVRADINSALAAAVSLNSSATEPATMYAYMLWEDTSTTPKAIKQRNSTNTAWEGVSVAPATAAEHATPKSMFDGATGHIGETIESIISTATNLPATTTFGDLTSISLTAGKWLIMANAFFAANGATVQDVLLGISTTSGNTNPSTPGDLTLEQIGPTAVTNSSISIVAKLITVASTTTYYLKYYGAYTVATPQAKGRLSAVRIAL